jgi:hypothetical protein
MKEFLYQPHSIENVERGAELLTDVQFREKLCKAISRMHDEDILRVFRNAYALDFIIQEQHANCRFNVVPTMEYVDLLNNKHLRSYQSPLPGKRVWTKDEIARVIVEFPQTRPHLAYTYNYVFATEWRETGPDGHSFAVPMEQGYVVVYMDTVHRSTAENLAKPTFPSEKATEDVMHQLSLAGWRMPEGWTLKRTGVETKGR